MSAQLVETIRTTLQPSDNPYLQGAWRPTHNEWDAVFANGHAEVAWAKLNALAEGARIASRKLWGR